MSVSDLQVGPIEVTPPSRATRAVSLVWRRLGELRVGESFTVAIERRVNAADAKAAAHSYARIHGCRFTTGREGDGTLYRIRRIA